MKTKLTDAGVARIKPPAKGQADYWDALQPGFGLRISFGGTRTWLCQTRVLKEGKWGQTRVTLGRYPALSLADAREKARLILQAASEGKNPRKLAKQDKEALEEASRQTFKTVGDNFLRQWVKLKGRRDSTEAGYKAALHGTHVADWQDLPVSSITRADIRDKLSKIVGSTPIQANRFRAYWSKFFGWCLEQDIIDNNPMAGVKALAPEKARDRVLSTAEIKALLDILNGSKSVMAPVFEMLLLTGQRRSEIAELQWSEVKDLDGTEPRIELAGERTKNRRPHIIPLAPQAVAIIKAAPRFALVSEGGKARLSEYVFSESGKSPVSGFSKFKEWIDTQLTAKLEAEPPAWIIHDLRRTVATTMNDVLGIEPHVVEAVLNHVSGASKVGVAGTYNRAAYLPQRRVALTSWASYLDGLTGKAPPTAWIEYLDSLPSAARRGKRA